MNSCIMKKSITIVSISSDFTGVRRTNYVEQNRKRRHVLRWSWVCDSKYTILLNISNNPTFNPTSRFVVACSFCDILESVWYVFYVADFWMSQSTPKIKKINLLLLLWWICIVVTKELTVECRLAVPEGCSVFYTQSNVT